MNPIAVCLLALALPLTYASLTLSQCNSQTNGDKWWSGLIQKQCKWTSSKTEIILVACRTPAKHTVVQPGGDARDGDFHYECEGDEDSLELSVEHCYMPSNGPALLVGESAVKNGGKYTCEEVEKNGEISVTRTWSKVTEGCEYKGVKYNLYAYFRDTASHTILRCIKRSGQVTMEAAGCLMPDGKNWARFWTSKGGKFCEPKKNNKQGSTWLDNAVTCQAKDGSTKNLNSEWIEEGGMVRCVLSNLSAYKKGDASVLLTKIIFWRCYRKINNKHFKVNRNGASKAADGKYYACRVGTGLNHLGTTMYELVELSGGGHGTATSFKCEIKGQSVNINSWLIIDNVRYRCYYNQRARFYISNCQADDKKYTSKNKVRDFTTHAMICEQKNGVVVWRRLTAAEYKIWKESKGGSISATGGSGTGAEGAVTTCDEGFEIVEVDGVRTCKDINECTKGGHDCDSTERCHNTEGKWACLCKAGTVRIVENDTCGDIDCPCTGDNPPVQR